MVVNEFERGQFDANYAQIQMCTEKILEYPPKSISILTKMASLASASTVPPKKLNFEYVFRPAYYYSRFAGIWTFSITHDSNGSIQRARVGFFDILWPIFVICSNSVLAFSAYQSFMAEREKYANTTRYIAENIFQMSCFLFVAIGIVLNVINRNRLVDILRRLNTFDNEVRH